MLNLTSSMLVAFREVIRTGKRYPGDIVYFAVADEEAGSVLGAKQLLADHWDVLHCDYVISEYGGTPSFGDNGTTVLLTTGEKHSGARRVTVHGTPSHGSMSYATDNALIKASEIVRRIAAAELTPRLDDVFAARVGALGLDPEIQKQLLDPAHIADALVALPPALASNLHSCSHMTINPNTIQSGEKLNTVPDTAVLELDIRMLPGQTQQDVDRLLPEIIGPDLMPSVEIEWYRDDLTNGFGVSSTESPLWDALGDAIRVAYPEATVMPSLVTGGTDCRFYRERGIPAYGAGLLSDKVPLSEFLSRFHGNDERIDVDSLRLTTQLFLNVFDRLWR
jgi:acetylornithine deacetylase/succinyl-diaminopimelate desuccinylase-like protein